ncbi:YeeE/YedE family protein [Kistimonas asteriae]|uniref:YeeE/YedE family protein n=1 Tax=Kistimonas asteriae TaxID=517724 RepID=UPI001BAB36CC|nr:YeeE/YedE thiosulfate transporter family protein [Kistimonas asteriae]
MSAFTPLSGLLGGMLIGLSAALLLWCNGRVAGISGIIGGIRRGDSLWRIAFLMAMGAGGMTTLVLSGKPLPVPASSPLLLISAGLLVGLGTRLGSGCTSGHGVCGLARFSVRSLVAVMVFMATAMLTVFIVRHLV